MRIELTVESLDRKHGHVDQFPLPECQAGSGEDLSIHVMHNDRTRILMDRADIAEEFSGLVAIDAREDFLAFGRIAGMFL